MSDDPKMVHYAPPCTTKGCRNRGWSGTEKDAPFIPVAATCSEHTKHVVGEVGFNVEYLHVRHAKLRKKIPPFANCCKSGNCTEQD